MKTRFSLILLIGLCSVQLFAQSWTVTHTGDTGAGSLRQAIVEAVVHAGADTIRFAIPATDAGFDGSIWTIRMASLFLNLSGDSLVIDGESQTLFGGDTHSEGPEIFISGELMGDDTHGFSITGPHHVIRHLGFVGFKWYALAIWRETALGNRISNCYMGQHIVGEDTLRNRTGIYMAQGAAQNVIENSVFCGHISDGIHASNVHQNEITGNVFGLAADGVTLMGNGGEAIDFRDGASQNCVGGVDEADRNIIVGSGYSGIAIGGAGTRENEVVGNLIGLHGDGETPHANATHGIHIYGGATANIIGMENAGNVISGNARMGVNISSAGTDSNAVAYNRIGLAANSDTAVPNGEAGMRVTSGASDNTVGPGNLIHYNRGPGLWVVGDTSLRNTITRNSFSHNEAAGIDLVAGGNGGIAPPVMTGRAPLAGSTQPGALVELFSDTGDEGLTYEGETLAGDDGLFTFEGTPAGPYVTATATDSDGNTSAFSVAQPVGSILVTHTLDVGEGSLRWALAQANAHAGPDIIDFNMPQTDPGFDGTVWRIQNLSNLPTLSEGQTTIRGASQTLAQGETNAAGPEVMLDGSQSSEGNGFSVVSAHNQISGVIVSNYRDYGIAIYGHAARHNVITGCYGGTTPDGLGSEGNRIAILIDDGADSNRVGGPTVDERNVLSGNLNDGIHLGESDYNVIIGNYIGTDPSGMLNNGNGAGGLGDGVDIRNTAQYNVVGGFTPEERNLISGNASVGVRFHLPETSFNRVVGNWIGLDASGSGALPNALYGVFIHEGSARNIVGGTEPGALNVISGNTLYGVNIIHDGSDHNQVLGNWIGLNATGDAAVPNGICGVHVADHATDNIIGPANVISGNVAHGIMVEDESADRMRISGNWIGLLPSGADTLANGGWGVLITEGADHTRIGDAELGGNLISGNRQGGIALLQGESDSAHVAENRIGLNNDGSAAPGNGGPGMQLSGASHQISGNTVVASGGHGLALTAVIGARIDDNNIGCDADNQLFPNDSSGVAVFAGSLNDTLGPGNRIWGNGRYGIELRDATVTGLMHTQNSIAGHSGAGVFLAAGANNGVTPPVLESVSPLIGHTLPNATVELYSDDTDEGVFYEGTVIADGQGRFVYEERLEGLYITAITRDDAGNSSVFSAPMMVGELIVTHSGDTGLGSLRWAIEQANLRLGSSTVEFQIPQTDPGFDGQIWRLQPASNLPVVIDDSTFIHGESQTHFAGNLNTAGPEIVLDGAESSGGVGLEIASGSNRVSGLTVAGFTDAGIAFSGATARNNRLTGCFIGTTHDGRGAAGNDVGVRLNSGAAANRIGGETLADMNIISGNIGTGLLISASDSNVVVGNRIGTDATGFLAVGNGVDGIGHGVRVYESLGNQIGDDGEMTRNLISGNEGTGLDIRGEGTNENYIRNNWIGVDVTGWRPLANKGDGIRVSGAAVGNTVGPENRIRFNRGWGVNLVDSDVQQLTMTENSISRNDSGGVFIHAEANGGVQAPVISGVDPVTGTAAPGATVEIFSDSTRQGWQYEGKVTADDLGGWQWDGAPDGPFITAVMIDGQGNTSAFAEPLPLNSAVVPGAAMPTAFSLGQNYPNPFNPVTNIEYDVPVKSMVKLIVYNILGRPVAVLSEFDHAPGHYRVQFDASALPSGIYFCRLQSELFSSVKKMILLE